MKFKKKILNVFPLFKSKIEKYEKYDLILILCPPWSLNTPPLGASYLSSFLTSKNINSKILDLNIILYNKYKNMQRYWHYKLKDEWLDESSLSFLFNEFSYEIKKFILEIISTRSNLIGFSAYQNNIKFILRLAYKIKKIKPNIKIVVGGPSCSIKEERLMFQRPFIDFIVIGEGEKTLFELIKNLKGGGLNKLCNISGLMVFPFKEELFVERGPLDKNEMVFYKNDINNIKKYSDPPIAPIFMSKGCICKCNFCNDRVLMGPYRVRPIEQIVKEIKYYVENGITTLSFSDLLINGNVSHLERFCDVVIKEKITIHWVSNALASKNLTYNILSKMKKAGCDNLVFGIESGSNKVLKDMDKPIKIKDCTRILKDCKKIGIGTWVNFIVGYPTENQDDFKKTIKFIENNHMFIDKILNANACNVLRNSDLYLNKEKYNIATRNNDKLEEINWYTKDKKNTLSVREKRLKFLLKKAKELKIKVEQTNITVINYYQKKCKI